MIVFEPGGRPTITALTQCTLMCLGGEPVGERLIWWNLVASVQDKIDRAKADWAAWKDHPRFSLPPNDNEEFIPCRWRSAGGADELVVPRQRAISMSASNRTGTR
jgi:hypothetical protein